MPERVPPSPHQLKIWALLILYQMAHSAAGAGYPRTWLLRFVLAFLYSHTNRGDRGPFDGFWKAATRPRMDGTANGTSGYERRMDMRREAGRICLAVGEEPKAIHDHFWDELTREAYAKRGEEVRILK